MVYILEGYGAQEEKNFDPIKGIPFNDLSIDSLNQIAVDASVKIGMDSQDTCKVIGILVDLDKMQYEHFVDANPECLVLASIDADFKMSSNPKEGIVVPELVFTLAGSMKEPDTSESWTEVVRKRKKRNKTRSRTKNIVSNDRVYLEY
jgi:hypothetical protein